MKLIALLGVLVMGALAVGQAKVPVIHQPVHKIMKLQNGPFFPPDPECPYPECNGSGCTDCW